MLASSLLLTAGLLLSPPAHANGDWDWKWEDTEEIWRTASLQWAYDINPSHPATSYLLSNVHPPPREWWCVYAGEPTAEDFEIFNLLLAAWTREYLGTPAGQPLPQGVIALFPEECQP